MQIRVHSYESMGTFDGPGLRYVVFLQGGPFRCLYCANPDTIDAVGESKLTDPEYIVEQAVSMKPFFGKRGGITFSGGEPTVQAEALVPLFKKLKEAGLHICVDSNPNVTNTLRSGATNKRCARPNGSNSTITPSGCATCWCQD